MSDTTGTVVTWDQVSARAGRNDLPGILADHIADLHGPELAAALTDAWTMPEWPEQHIDAMSWVMLFEQVGYMVDGTPVDQHTDLPELVTLYRGGHASRRAGMSWTSDQDIAFWFARRFLDSLSSDPVHVWSITIPRVFVLARFNASRGEHEHVVDTTGFDDEEYDLLATLTPTTKDWDR